MYLDSPKKVSSYDLAEVADANLVAHAGWVQQRVDGMSVTDQGGLVRVDSGLPCDTFNFICRARLTIENAERQVKEAISYFVGVNRPFSWWLGPADRPTDLGDVLVAAGLQRDETELAMAADLAELEVGELSPGGLRIERVRTPEQLKSYARILAANWSPPDLDVMRFHALAEAVLLSDESAMFLYLGYREQEPIATAECTEGGGVVGLYNICTLEPYRRAGIGTAMTLQPLVDARDRGFRTAILQAAPDGVGVYTRVGFETFGRITEYKPPPSSE